MSATTLKRESARERILDLAEAAVLQKGFGATSIEELIAGAGISKSGFFYHFPDKGALAKALLQRSMERDRELLGDVFARAEDLADDPLHGFLVGLKVLAEQMAGMSEVHPGCMVATVTYQERLFDEEVRRMNVEYLMRMRRRFARWLSEIAAVHPPRAEVDLDALADNLTATVEGAIILSKALGDEGLMGRQMRLYRSYVRLLFGG